MSARDCTHLPRELRDLAGDLRYCKADSLAATLMYAAADEIERLRLRLRELAVQRAESIKP